MSLNYPFVEGTKNQADYKDKVIKIIRNIIDGMKIMHSLDVAMGDISLTNIMVNVEDMSGLMEGDRFELEEESFEDAGFREAELSEIDDDSNIGISEDE